MPTQQRIRSDVTTLGLVDRVCAVHVATVHIIST
jgi:hypothetical protein